MMYAVVVLAVVASLASASYVPSHGQIKPKYADHDFLVKQKEILEVLHHVRELNGHTDQHTKGKEYSIEANVDKYTNTQAVKEFLHHFKTGMLSRGEIFSIANEHHREEVIALFHVFFYAKDWDTFYNTMVWARDHVNEGMFVYALTVAVTHRNDLQGIILPPPYELYPNYFVSAEAIHEANLRKMEGAIKEATTTSHNLVIRANYTGWTTRLNDEQKLSYFTEDIGLNSFYYYFHTDYPFWMEGKEFNLNKDRRGEYYIFMHQQLLARYYLERLSNNMGKIRTISWDKPIETGFYPSLRYTNGIDFPVRPNHLDLHQEENVRDLIKIEDFERRIRDAIDMGFLVNDKMEKVDIRTPEAIELIGNMIQSNPDSENTRFYRCLLSVVTKLIGNSYERVNQHEIVPSALEHFETAMRDPVFYQMYKRILGFYTMFKETLPHYTQEELTFSGVKIDNVVIEKLITYFDHFDFDISNAVLRTEKERIQNERLDIFKARQMRLNHKPFTYNLEVTSEEDVDAVVRVYLGPKYDENGHQYTSINQYRDDFIELDTFAQKLKTGKNTIVRNSRQYVYNVADRTSHTVLYEKVLKALENKEQFPLDMSEAHCLWPDRLLLPRGNRGGMHVQFYFIITPLHAPAMPQGSNYDTTFSCGVGSGSKYIDTLPFGFPFDRVIEESVFNTPNMYFKDAVIYHKKESEINRPGQVE